MSRTIIIKFKLTAVDLPGMCKASLLFDVCMLYKDYRKDEANYFVMTILL